MYPARPKPAYYAISESLRPVLFSARIPKFDWKAGEVFKAEIWMLNDSPFAADGEVSVSLKVGDSTLPLLDWKNVHTDANTNLQGAQVCCILPNEADSKEMKLILTATDGMSSEYRLLYTPKSTVKKPKILNM
jgi:beta-mannosidase